MTMCRIDEIKLYIILEPLHSFIFFSPNMFFSPSRTTSHVRWRFLLQSGARPPPCPRAPTSSRLKVPATVAAQSVHRRHIAPTAVNYFLDGEEPLHVPITLPFPSLSLESSSPTSYESNRFLCGDRKIRIDNDDRSIC
jgi:hypothetical protein